MIENPNQIDRTAAATKHDENQNSNVSVVQYPVRRLTFFQRPTAIIEIAAGIATLIGAVYGTVIYIDSRIDARIVSKIAPFQEFIAGIAFHQISYDYNAATRLSKLYYKFRKDEDIEVMPPLVTALLEAIAQCGYPEDFINTLEQIQKDNLTPLRKRDLNEIGLIYLELGQIDKAENILKYASSLIESAYPSAKEIEAIIQWRLTLLYLTKNNIDDAVSSYTKAATLYPNNFKKRDFVFATKDEAIAYIDSDLNLLQRLKMQNPEFAIRLYELSTKIQQLP